MYVYIFRKQKIYRNIYIFYGGVQNLIKQTKRPNLFMLKNRNKQLTGFGPTWSQLNSEND